MGTVLSVVRAATGAPVGDTRELSGAEDAATPSQPAADQNKVGAETAAAPTGGVDKELIFKTDAGGDTTQATNQAIATTPTALEPLEKCFIEGDRDNWTPWVPTRIKESRLTNEERAKFQGHLDNIFSDKTIMGKRYPFDPNDVAEVMIKVREYLKSEPMLIDDIPCDITVVADLHGQLYDLDRVFGIQEKGGKRGWECMKYLFLGNYVDRGRQSLEIVMALFCLKMLYPDRIFLLRGNHEFVKTNYLYGFLHDFGERYEAEAGAQLYLIVNTTFCYLSTAAIIDNAYFCAHAGISPSGFTRQQMKGLRKPVVSSTEDVMIHDVVWSDPATGFRGVTFNGDRGTSIHYGFSALCHALDNMEVEVIIRGHTKLKAGYQICWETLYSIFTATATDDMQNDGAVAYINAEGKITLHILPVDPERTAWEKLLRGGAEQAPDEKTVVGDCDGNTTGKIPIMGKQD